MVKIKLNKGWIQIEQVEDYEGFGGDGYVFKVVNVRKMDNHDYESGNMIIADLNDVKIVEIKEKESNIMMIHTDNIFGTIN